MKPFIWDAAGRIAVIGHQPPVDADPDRFAVRALEFHAQVVLVFFDAAPHALIGIF